MPEFRIVAVGERDSIIGFKGVGVEILPVRSGSELEPILKRVTADPTVALILMTEPVAEPCLDLISQYREKTDAVLLIIPSHQGSRQISFQEMKRLIERAVGVNILEERGGG